MSPWGVPLAGLGGGHQEFCRAEAKHSPEPPVPPRAFLLNSLWAVASLQPSNILPWVCMQLLTAAWQKKPSLVSTGTCLHWKDGCGLQQQQWEIWHWKQLEMELNCFVLKVQNCFYRQSKGKTPFLEVCRSLHQPLFCALFCAISADFLACSCYGNSASCYGCQRCKLQPLARAEHCQAFPTEIKFPWALRSPGTSTLLSASSSPGSLSYTWA